MLPKLELTVHEFMAIMGNLDERMAGKPQTEDTSIYHEWYRQWKVLDERLEKLPPMQRADMLFDGKVSINAISEAHLKELIGVVKSQFALHRKLIDDGDEDADPEDLEVWQNRLADLDGMLTSSDWRE